MSKGTCGCCKTAEIIPVKIDNRPGLSAIAFRAGNFTTFREALLNQIAGTPELRSLRTRLSEDYAITLFELWSIVADILTFYQERIANEGYIRTARQRDSILRLAKLIDYRLGPGAAATTFLAFSVENDAKVYIPKGLRVQSVPVNNEPPQKYETTEAIWAVPTLNRIKIFSKPYYSPALAGEKDNAILHPYHAELMVSKLSKGDKLLLINPPIQHWIHSSISDGRIDPDSYEILSDITTTMTTNPCLTIVIKGYAYGGPNESYDILLSERFADKIKSFLINQGVDNSRITVMGLGRSEAISSNDSDTFAEIEAHGYFEEKTIDSISTSNWQRILTWSPAIQMAFENSFMLRWTRKFKLFGFNAPESYRKSEINESGELIWTEIKENGDNYQFKISSNNYLELDGIYDLKAGTNILVFSDDFFEFAQVVANEETHRSKGPLSATISKITLNTKLPEINNLRRIVVYELKSIIGNDAQILFWNYQYDKKINTNNIYIPSVQTNALLNLKKDGLQPGRRLIFDDETQDPQSSIIQSVNLKLAKADDDINHIQVTFGPELNRDLDTDSAFLYGNITSSSHGETIPLEIIGDGDAASSFQQFALQKKPVTYTPAPVSSGLRNSLKVKVNGALWEEVCSFYNRSKTDQIYTTRIDNNGTMSIQFGNGNTGARLPSGRGNLVAEYRQGTGIIGRVEKNKLTTLLDRPAGLKSVTNPAPADGGADPETLDQARKNAPSTVRTFDRAVSLKDFEDLVTASGVVAKASATWVWSNSQRVVYLTVAGQRGGRFSETELANIYDRLTARRDPNIGLIIVNFEPVTIQIKGSLMMDKTHDIPDAASTAREALVSALSFEMLEFGQTLHLSDIYKILQDIEGVESVDIDLFQFKDQSPANLILRGADDNPVQKHLRIFSARPGRCAHQPALPAEQANIGTPDTDILFFIAN